MAIRNQRLRFTIATIAAAVALIAAMLKLFGVQYFTLDFGGRLVALNPHPLEVILITFAVTLFMSWAYQWYKRDPVQHTVKQFTPDERRQMLQLLLEEEQPQKRKRNSSSLMNTDDDVFGEFGNEIEQNNHQHSSRFQ